MNTSLMISKFYHRCLKKANAIKFNLLNKNCTEILIPSNNLRFLVANDLIWAYSSGDYYETNVIHFLDEVVKNYHQPVLIDVGANCGYFSTRYAAQCKKVFSFEPVKGTFSLLKGNIKRNGIRNAAPFNLGLSDKAGEICINIYNSSGNNSIFERVLPAGHNLKKTGTEKIKLDTLDNLIGNDKVAPPDIIKIDVEGAELLVLKGAEQTILKHRPTILLEYSEATSNDAGYAKEDLLTVLELHDYNIYGIPEDEKDFRLILQRDFHFNKLSNIIFAPGEHDPLAS